MESDPTVTPGQPTPALVPAGDRALSHPCATSSVCSSSAPVSSPPAFMRSAPARALHQLASSPATASPFRSTYSQFRWTGRSSTIAGPACIIAAVACGRSPAADGIPGVPSASTWRSLSRSGASGRALLMPLGASSALAPPNPSTVYRRTVFLKFFCGPQPAPPRKSARRWSSVATCSANSMPSPDPSQPPSLRKALSSASSTPTRDGST